MITKPWFRDKRDGYGWGLPTGKEGWLVMITYLLLITVMIFQLGPKPTSSTLILFVVQFILTTFLLLAVCYASSERPNFRIGQDKSSKNK